MSSAVPAATPNVIDIFASHTAAEEGSLIGPFVQGSYGILPSKGGIRAHHEWLKIEKGEAVCLAFLNINGQILLFF